MSIMLIEVPKGVTDSVFKEVVEANWPGIKIKKEHSGTFEDLEHEREYDAHMAAG